MKTTALDVLSAPLATVEEGHLVFVRGASHLAIGVDGTMDDLFRARFDGKVPRFAVDGGTVTVKYRPGFHPPRGELTLSGRVPWAIDARWGMPMSSRISRGCNSRIWTSREGPLTSRSGCLARGRAFASVSAEVPATST